MVEVLILGEVGDCFITADRLNGILIDDVELCVDGQHHLLPADGSEVDVDGFQVGGVFGLQTGPKPSPKDFLVSIEGEVVVGI